MISASLFAVTGIVTTACNASASVYMRYRDGRTIVRARSPVGVSRQRIFSAASLRFSTAHRFDRPFIDRDDPKCVRSRMIPNGHMVLLE